MNIKIKHFIIPGILLLLSGIYSCTKEITTSGINSPANITWKTDTVTHHQLYCTFDTSNPVNLNLWARDTVWTDSVIVSYWNIRFSKRPSQSAIYSISGYNYNNPLLQIPDSMIDISGVNKLNKRLIGPYAPARDYNFYATGYNMPKVSVTMINGKIRVDVPPFWAYKLQLPNFTLPPFKDSVLVSGTMQED